MIKVSLTTLLHDCSRYGILQVAPWNSLLLVTSVQFEELSLARASHIYFLVVRTKLSNAGISSKTRWSDTITAICLPSTISICIPLSISSLLVAEMQQLAFGICVQRWVRALGLVFDLWNTGLYLILVLCRSTSTHWLATRIQSLRSVVRSLIPRLLLVLMTQPSACGIWLLERPSHVWQTIRRVSVPSLFIQHSKSKPLNNFMICSSEWPRSGDYSL